MGTLLFILRLPGVLLWLLSCLITASTVYPLCSVKVRASMNRAWSRTLMLLCGVRITVKGTPPAPGPSLWVANHVSWIDIFVMSSVRAVIFVAKAEIRRWPVIGWLVNNVGAVFVSRGERHSLKKVADQMRVRFAQGQVLGLFPEGTTSAGDDVLSFHSSLFDSAIRTGVDIQPVALRFIHKGQRSGRVAFVGEQSLIANLWVLLRSSGTEVEVDFLPLIPAAVAKELGRVGVARHTHEVIGQAVREPLAAGQEVAGALALERSYPATEGHES